jgi:oligopeptide/dipeptide ABC transporter ATP-binding protein
MAIVFQDPRSVVNPLWKVGDYLTEGMRVHRGLDRDAARTRALELLEQVEIDNPARRLNQYPGELSGGMLQRVMIAAALAGDPDLLIADEATTGLDVTTQAAIVKRFGELQRDRGLAMLFITHDLALASSLCDRICVMYAGRIVEMQPGSEIFERGRHPYTIALVAARPDVRERRPEGLTVIPGQPTSGLEAPPGCAFHPRCRFADEQCANDVPELANHGGGAGMVACLRTAAIEAGRTQEATK